MRAFFLELHQNISTFVANLNSHIPALISSGNNVFISAFCFAAGILIGYIIAVLLPGLSVITGVAIGANVGGAIAFTYILRELWKHRHSPAD